MSPSNRWIGLAAAALLAGCGIGGGTGAPKADARAYLAVSRAEPAASRREGPALSVTWVFSASDLLACEPPTNLLRSLQSRLGDRVRVSALFVGDEPESFPRTFLRNERLPVAVRQIGHDEFRRLYPGRELPIVIMSNGSQQTVYDQDAWRHRKPGHGDQLEHAVLRLAAARTR